MLNKQTPNRQLWLSSPLSGPHRFEYNPSQQKWFHARDNKKSLQQLLASEWKQVANVDVEFDEDF